MPRDLADLWHDYAETGPGEDAPTYRALAHLVAADAALLDVVRACPVETHHPNHLLAAVRFLLLGGVRHPLGDAYDARDCDAAVAAFPSFVAEHRDAIIDILQTRRTQTNEVGRIAVIAPALADVRRRVGRPLGLVDVGTSAGLNLLVDRADVDYGRFATETPGAELRLRCEVGEAPPPFTMADLEIGWRIGLDRSPIHPENEADSRWLLACVWPDQSDRIERLALALSMARGHPVELVEGDAVADLRAALERIPAGLHATVLTSWVTFYLSKDQRRGFEEVLAAAARPVTWVSLEHPRVVGDIPSPEPTHGQAIAPSVIASVDHDGDGGVVRRFLGWAHPHGRWLDWRPRG